MLRLVRIRLRLMPLRMVVFPAQASVVPIPPLPAHALTAVASALAVDGFHRRAAVVQAAVHNSHLLARSEPAILVAIIAVERVNELRTHVSQEMRVGCLACVPHALCNHDELDDERPSIALGRLA